MLETRPSIAHFPISVGTGTWLNFYTYRDQRDWLTVKGASQKTFKLPRKSLERATKSPCRFLMDDRGLKRTIVHQWVQPPCARNRELVLVLLKSDLETISGLRQERQGS